jgi:hypothetical protein
MLGHEGGHAAPQCARSKVSNEWRDDAEHRLGASVQASSQHLCMDVIFMVDEALQPHHRTSPYLRLGLIQSVLDADDPQRRV